MGPHQGYKKGTLENTTLALAGLYTLQNIMFLWRYDDRIKKNFLNRLWEIHRVYLTEGRPKPELCSNYQDEKMPSRIFISASIAR